MKGPMVGAILLVATLSYPASTQDRATPQELMQKVQEAAASLSKTGEAGLAAFDSKPGPWAWKDSYVFVLDCEKGIMAAHPKADLVGKPLTALRTPAGTLAFELLCAATKSASGTWAEYSIPKPGEKEVSRKISYAYQATGTAYVAGAGIFDPVTSITDLEKLITK